VSSFGQYEGYSVERFDGWETFSQYVEMRDGVRLAVDVTLPARNGEVTDEALPVVWTHSRYHRRMLGRPMPEVFPGLQRLLRHGYVVASAGVRGSGASFGVYAGLFSEAETLDAVELIEWFAAQPFCDGNVGMFGSSYLGITQYMAASKRPSALRGFKITGNPTRSTNSSTSSTEAAPVDWAVAMPASRRASFMAGLSRHKNAVR